eukprot:SAG11_NODE_4067_length_2081_cov_1.993946_2_plen_93_part_00
MAQDWALGVAEAIAAVIVIGFSVDFTVHFAHMYIESDETSREGRFRYAAQTMGVTVRPAAAALGSRSRCSCRLWSPPPVLHRRRRHHPPQLL